MKEDHATVLKSRIDRVLWGKTVANVLDGDCNERSFVLRSLTICETVLIENLYDCEMKRALSLGMQTEEALREIYERDKIWTSNDDIYLKGLENKIGILADKIENEYSFMRSRKKKAQREIKKTRVELEEKRDLKRELLGLSAENWADEIKRRHMVFLATQNLDMSPASTQSQNMSQYWPTVDAFMRERDFVLIFNLAMAYYKQNILETAEVREMARSSMWRYRWNMAKNGADLFGKPIAEWSDSQNTLLYWSQYYDFIFDSTDRPHDSVIENDIECDKWYDAQLKKMRTERVDASKPQRPKKVGPKKFHQEQFVMVEKGDMETVNEVQGMNSELVRAQLKEEQQYIKDKGGRVKEWELRKQRYIRKDM